MCPALRRRFLLALLLAGTLLAAPALADAQSADRAELHRQVLAVAPPGHDNDPLADTLTLPAERRLGQRTDFVAWRTRGGTGTEQERVTGVVLPVVTGRGYGGEIVLLVGIDHEGRVTGARVLHHQESPGFGDGIEITHDDWIRQFEGRGLEDQDDAWALRSDGGDFDTLSGATVTSRAVVHAVYQAVLYVERHRERLLDPAAR